MAKIILDLVSTMDISDIHLAFNDVFRTNKPILKSARLEIGLISITVK